MKKPRKEREYRAAPPQTGNMECDRGHVWKVVDQNPEIGSIKCPVCGTMTSIKKGFTNA